MNTTELAICFLGMEKRANITDMLKSLSSGDAVEKFNGVYELSRGVDHGLSGAFRGAALGGLAGAGYGLYRQNATDDEQERKNPGIIRKALLGALAGGGIGGIGGGGIGLYRGNRELASGNLDFPTARLAADATRQLLLERAQQ